MVGKSHSSVSCSSNGLSSPVEDEPLSVVLWLIVSDSKSVLTVSNVLVIEESSSASHQGLDLESDSISEWISVVSNMVSV